MTVFDVGALRSSVKASGIKQKYMAERAGIAEKTLSYMLTGRTRLPIEVYAEICGILGKELTEFVRRDERVRVS